MLAQRAVDLDGGESSCHAILAYVFVGRRSFDLAVQYARRAIEINPNNQWSAADLGTVLMYSGETQEAITWFARAREIDPYFDEAWYWRGLGEAYMIMHRHEDALATLTRSRARQYRFAALMAACHAELGDMDRARASVADCLTMRPGYSVRQFLQKERFKNPADAAPLAGSLRLAGFPG